MAADWSLPALSSAYSAFLSNLVALASGAATMEESPVTPPTGYIRYNTTLFKLQRWSGAAWVDIVFAVAGGGTGGSNAAAARTNLGIGTMGVQASNAIAVTGGTISGLSALTIAALIAFSADNTHDIGTNAVRPRNIFARSGMVAPVGADKWVVV